MMIKKQYTHTRDMHLSQQLCGAILCKSINEYKIVRILDILPT